MDAEAAGRCRGAVGAMCWLAEHGAPVLLPIGHSPDYDMEADFGGISCVCK